MWLGTISVCTLTSRDERVSAAEAGLLCKERKFLCLLFVT